MVQLSDPDERPFARVLLEQLIGPDFQRQKTLDIQHPLLQQAYLITVKQQGDLRHNQEVV